jgi:hypothetical protein
VTAYKLVGSDHPVTLGGGQDVGPGETVELSADDIKDPYTKELIDGDALVKAEADKKQGDKEGGS